MFNHQYYYVGSVEGWKVATFVPANGHVKTKVWHPLPNVVFTLKPPVKVPTSPHDRSNNGLDYTAQDPGRALQFATSVLFTGLSGNTWETAKIAHESHNDVTGGS